MRLSRKFSYNWPISKLDRFYRHNFWKIYCFSNKSISIFENTRKKRIRNMYLFFSWAKLFLMFWPAFGHFQTTVQLQQLQGVKTVTCIASRFRITEQLPIVPKIPSQEQWICWPKASLYSRKCLKIICMLNNCLISTNFLLIFK